MSVAASRDEDDWDETTPAAVSNATRSVADARAFIFPPRRNEKQTSRAASNMPLAARKAGVI
jgi:hypothetical protein